MQNVQHSEQQKRRRKMLLFLPLLVFPFLSLFFWALGGGKEKASDTKPNNGLNVMLPDAKLKSDRGLDKLSFYQQANKDSAKLSDAKKSDPYWIQFKAATARSDSGESLNRYHFDNLPPDDGSNEMEGKSGVEANQSKVYSKLSQLNKALANSREASAAREQQVNTRQSIMPRSNSESQVKRLEDMMRQMKEDKTEDPELHQLNTMLDKIAAIQHPELVKEQADDADPLAANDPAFEVKRKIKQVAISTIQTASTASPLNNVIIKPAVAFYDENNRATNDDSVLGNTIQAIVPTTQTLVSGATIKLSLAQDIVVQGNVLAKGSALYGTVSLNNERLIVKITSLIISNNVLPVSMNIYDLDGLEGIYIPGSISSETARQSTDRSMNGMRMTTIDPSLGAQAAGAGIDAAKSLLTKKVKLVKVTVKAGYKVLLVDKNASR